VIHARATIRSAVVARLAAGATAAGTRVYEHPTDPRTAFPALQVEDIGEQQQVPTRPGGPQRLVERTLLLEVTAELQMAGAYANARDELVADVERLLLETPVPGVREVRPAGYAPETAPGERPLAIGRQRFELFYMTTAADPATAR
jgi:hypothetical protein